MHKKHQMHLKHISLEKIQIDTNLTNTTDQHLGIKKRMSELSIYTNEESHFPVAQCQINYFHIQPHEGLLHDLTLDN